MKKVAIVLLVAVFLILGTFVIAREAFEEVSSQRIFIIAVIGSVILLILMAVATSKRRCEPETYPSMKPMPSLHELERGSDDLIALRNRLEAGEITREEYLKILEMYRGPEPEYPDDTDHPENA